MKALGDVEPTENGAAPYRPAKKSIVDHQEFYSTDGWKILTLVLGWGQALFSGVNRVCCWSVILQLFAKLTEDGDIQCQNV